MKTTINLTTILFRAPVPSQPNGLFMNGAILQWRYATKRTLLTTKELVCLFFFKGTGLKQWDMAAIFSGEGIKHYLVSYSL